jgi:hypothetical protein
MQNFAQQIKRWFGLRDPDLVLGQDIYRGKLIWVYYYHGTIVGGGFIHVPEHPHVYHSGVNHVKRRQRSTATYVALVQAPGNRLYKNKGPLNVEPKATQFPISFTVKGVTKCKKLRFFYFSADTWRVPLEKY